MIQSMALSRLLNIIWCVNFKSFFCVCYGIEVCYRTVIYNFCKLQFFILLVINVSFVPWLQDLRAACNVDTGSKKSSKSKKGKKSRTKDNDYDENRPQ